MNSTPTPERIAQIVGNISSGGVASVVLNYYRNIDRAAFQFDFYSYGPSSFDKEIGDLGGRVFYIPKFSRPGAVIALKKLLLRNGPYRIVHSHINTLSCFSLRAARAAGVPVRIAHNHSTSAPREFAAPVKNLLKPFVKKYATHLAACSRSSARWIFGADAEKAVIFNNAVDLQKFRFDPEKREKERARLGINDNFVIAHAGRFVYQKNHEFLVEMMKEVSRREPAARLMLAGNGKLLPDIKRRAEKAGLSGKVLFLGEHGNMDDFWNAADVLALPSRFEGLPVVAVEAEAAGLPAVLSDAVTRDAGIANSRFLLLSVPLWTDTVLSLKGFSRTDTTDALRVAGFDIETEAGKLTEYYKNL